MDFTEIPDEEDEGREKLKKRPSCLLGLFRLFLVALIPLAILTALMPTLLSCDPAREWALKKINAAIAPAQLGIDEWSLGWFTPQAMVKVSFSDPAHGVNATADEVVFDRGLLRLLPIGTLNFGRVALKNPSAAISLIPPPLPTEKMTSPEKEKKGFFVLPVADAAATLTLEKGSLSVSGNAPTPFEARQVNATVTLESIFKPIYVQTQMTVGGGTLDLEGHVQSPKDLFKNETFEKPEKLTLKAVGVDLTAFCPLIEHACGTPWICSGSAEGALTAVVEGPNQFKVDGGVLVTGLSVAPAGQTPSPKGDLALMVDLGYDKRVISVNKFELSSPWLRANAKGTLQKNDKTGTMTGTLSATGESDLANVARDFGPVLGLAKNFKMQKGRLQATVGLNASANALKVDASLTTVDLAMSIDGEPLVLRPAPSLVFKATFPYGQWPEVETLHLKAPFADVYGNGRFDAAVLKGSIDLTRFSRDFKRMLKDAPPTVGSIYLDLATRRDGDRVAANAFLKISDLAAELHPGQLMIVPHGALKLEGCVPLKNDKPVAEIQDASFELTLEKGKLSGGWKRFVPTQGDRPFVLRGFSLTSDMNLGSVGRLLGGFIPPAAQRRLSEWQGRAIANATAEAAGGVVKARMNAAGQEIVASSGGDIWRIPDVRVEGSLTQAGPKEGVQIDATVTGCGALEENGSTVFAEKSAKLDFDILFAPDNASAHLSKLNLTTSLFDLQSQADLNELATRCVADVHGKIAVNFEAVTDLLESRGFDSFTLTGNAPRDFHLTAPLAGGVTTLFSEGTFSGAAHVASLKGLGLDAGASDIALRLAKGCLRMAYTPPLNGGKLQLTPELAAEHGNTTLSFPPQTRLLDTVALNQEMVDTLLVNINPLFNGSKVLGGTVTVDLKSCSIVTGLTPDKGVAIDMDILFKNLKLDMGPSLRELLAMLKAKDHIYRAEQLPVHLTVRNGRICVDPIRMTIDRQPIIFSGWVNFNGAIKYLVEVPVTERLIGGTGGKLLKGTTIKIPVTGTVNEPRLDTSALNNTIGGIIKSAAGEHAVEKIGSFLEKLQQELQK